MSEGDGTELEAPRDDADPSRRDDNNGVGSTLLGLAVIAVLAVAGYFVMKAVDPGGDLRPRSGAGFLELVVSNRTLLVVVRLTLLAIAAYVVYSVFALVKARRPIVRIGPADTQEVGKQASNAAEAGEDALRRVRELEDALEESNALSDALIADVEALRALLDERDRPGPVS